MTIEHGKLVVYQTEDGQAGVDVRLIDETVWLSQSQMVELFDRNKRTVSEHIRNVFKEGELDEQAVVRKSRTTAADHKVYEVRYYNLDVIISVGYRVKSSQGTKFRIWATSLLKDHLVRGYTINQKRLAEKGIIEASQMLRLLKSTLITQNMVSDEGRDVLDLVNSYTKTWQLLWQYDEDSLPISKTADNWFVPLDLEQARGLRYLESLKLTALSASGVHCPVFL